MRDAGKVFGQNRRLSGGSRVFFSGHFCAASLDFLQEGDRTSRYRLFQLLNPLPRTSDASVTDMKAFGSFSARNCFSCMA